MKAPLTMSRLLLCLQTWAADVREGFVEITRHSLALFGLAVVLVSLTFLARPSLQASASEALIGWLQIRQNDPTDIPAASNAATRSTAAHLKDLTAEQLAVTRWLSRKYRVSSEPLGAMVAEAWTAGERSQLAPTLILAIMAIESRFNPFASGSQGNVGLMQIEPQAHAETLGQFGGPLSAFDPLTNLRVGVRHLQGLVQQTETLEEALFLYGSSSGQLMESQYVERVLAEQQLLDKVTEKRNTAALASKAPRAQL
jgi:soluble lytic murein transglycosylase-like protein